MFVDKIREMAETQLASSAPATALAAAQVLVGLVQADELARIADALRELAQHTGEANGG